MMVMMMVLNVMIHGLYGGDSGFEMGFPYFWKITTVKLLTGELLNRIRIGIAQELPEGEIS